jgi:hypothetical protein
LLIAFNTGLFNNYFVILEATMKVSHHPLEINAAKADSSAWTYVKFVSVALVATLASFAMSTQVSAQSMSKAEYGAAKTRISADYKADILLCKQLTGNAKDICIEEGKAKEKISNAELTFSYSGKTADSFKISTVKADTSYAIAKEKCDDLAGIPKTTCVTAAKATHTKVLADIKMGKQINAAKIDDAQTKLDADYKLATQNCAALADEAKSSCVSAAKMKFGK